MSRWPFKARKPDEMAVKPSGLFCGGKYRVPYEVYHSIPHGWDAGTVADLHRRLGGRYPIFPPRAAPLLPWQRVGSWFPLHPWSAYRETLYNIADGVRAGDAACVELAIRFIELRFIGSYSGFVRELFARRLKHAKLTTAQRQRLSTHFLHLLVTGDRCEEFRDYVRLWARVVSPEELAQIRQLLNERPGDGSKFLQLVVSTLTQGLSVRTASGTSD